MSIEFSGLNELLGKLGDLGGSATNKHVRRKMAENVADLHNASDALAPIDEGDLIGTSFHRTRAQGDTLIGEVAYVAQNDGYPYAVRQHEDTTLKPGPKTALKPDYDGESAGPKYLERPLVKYTPKYFDNLAEGVQAAIEEVAKK